MLRLRFTTRHLAAAFVVLGLLLAWLSHRIHCGKSEETAVKLLEPFCVIDHDFELDSDGGYTTNPPPGAAILRRLLGPYFFQHVVRINFTWMTANESPKLKSLKYLHQLREIYLDHTTCSDNDCDTLSKVTTPEVLSVRHCPISDKGVAALSSLRSLKWLALDDTDITDQSLTHLRKLDQLESISIASTSISDGGLRSLEGMTSLQYICVANTNVTQGGVARLRHALPNSKVIVSE